MLNRKFIPLLVTFTLFFVLFGVGAVQFEGFGSWRVFFNLFSDNAFLIIAAIGMTFVIISGGIDLSVGAVIALTGVVCSVLISHYQWHPLLAFAAVLIGGTLFGACMGAIIHYYKMQPFIVTLAGMFFARGLASVISEESIAIDHVFYNNFSAWGFEVFDGAWIGASSILCVLVLIIAVLLAHFTRFGGRVYALGGDGNSAALMGIPLASTTISIYATSSLLASLAGIVYSLYTFSGYSLAAVGMELDAIAAVVIGGTLLTGGYGYVLGTLVGVLIMGLVQTYIAFDGTLSSWWTKIVIGLLLFSFIAMQRVLSKVAPNK